jgi:ATP-dependent DNA helicase DinG
MPLKLPTPADLGLPPEFVKWNPGQDTALTKLIHTSKRFPVAQLPTGTGKSPLPVALAQFLDLRVLILTATKGLQDQYINQFKDMGIRDVRGMGNYLCYEDTRVNCDEGPCMDGYHCQFRQGGCLYFDAREAAEKARIVVTNYAWWMTQNQKGEDIGEFDLIVCDEAHAIDREVSGFMRIEINEPEVHMPRGEPSWDRWQSWAKAAAEVHAAHVKTMPIGRARRKARRVTERLERLATAGGEWAWEKTHTGWAFEPKWSKAHIERLVFKGAPMVLLMSATITPATLGYLGIEPGDYDWIEVPSPFPVNSRLVTHVQSGVRLTSRSSQQDIESLVRMVDRLIYNRLDRKIIIHTVSYRRAEDIIAMSEFGDLMMFHDSRSTARIVAEFKRTAAPAILVSPSVSTGWDFPMDEARCQIILKVPFPDATGDIMRARKDDDPRYISYLVASELQQMVGRGVRKMGDWCETIILDDNITWAYGRNKDMFTAPFKQAFRSISELPPPPPLVIMGSKAGPLK